MTSDTAFNKMCIRDREETVVVLGVLEGDENRSGDAQENTQAAKMREMGTTFVGKKDAAQSQKTELRILTQNGVRMAASSTFLTESMRFCPVRAIVRDDCLYAVRNGLTEPVILKNVWMIETTGQSIHGFWKDCEFSGAATVEVRTDSAEGQGTEENSKSDWKSDQKSTIVVSDTAQLSEAVCDLTFETGKPVVVCQMCIRDRPTAGGESCEAGFFFTIACGILRAKSLRPF